MVGVLQKGAPPSVELSERRRARLDIVLSYFVERRRSASSKQLERLLGHWCFACLIRRCALTAPRACYDFARAGYSWEQELWPSAVSEVRILRGPVPLLRSDPRLETDPVATAFDACESGHTCVDVVLSKRVATEAT